MENYEVPFKGIWMPKEVLIFTHLSALALIIYSQVHDQKDESLYYEITSGDLKEEICAMTECEEGEFDAAIEELKDHLIILRSFNKEFHDFELYSRFKRNEAMLKKYKGDKQ